MSDRYFPEIPPDAWWGLEIILRNTVEDPGYLQDEGCPYPSWFREMSQVVAPVEGDLDLGDDIDLEAESARLFRELRDAKEGFGVTDHAEKMAYFRTSTTLLDKLIAMNERARNVKQVSRFYRAVLDVMEEVLDGDQREQVRGRLKEMTE